MTTRPLWTPQAVVAFLAGDEPCRTCGGHGRVHLSSRDARTCPMCRGNGAILSARDALDLRMSRSEWKAARRINP